MTMIGLAVRCRVFAATCVCQSPQYLLFEKLANDQTDTVNPMPTLLHITSQTAWQNAVACGQYVAASFHNEGFIHCSKPDQVQEVANRLFRGQQDLVLLCIDPARITARIIEENLEGGDTLYPHIYGPIPVTAVQHVLPFPPNANGTFE